MEYFLRVIYSYQTFLFLSATGDGLDKNFICQVLFVLNDSSIKNKLVFGAKNEKIEIFEGVFIKYGTSTTPTLPYLEELVRLH